MRMRLNFEPMRRLQPQRYNVRNSTRYLNPSGFFLLLKHIRSYGSEGKIEIHCRNWDEGRTRYRNIRVIPIYGAAANHNTGPVWTARHGSGRLNDCSIPGLHSKYETPFRSLDFVYIESCTWLIRIYKFPSKPPPVQTFHRYL